MKTMKYMMDPEYQHAMTAQAMAQAAQ